jgi:hypothetical protein
MAQHLSREEFRRWAEKQDRRYERIAGEPVAMSPERIEHVRIKSRIWAALDRAIRAGNLPCEALGDGVTIEIDEDTDYGPDAVVNCGPPAPGDAVAVTNPVVKVASIQHYLNDRTRRREVIHHSRSGSEIVSRVINIGSIVLNPPGISIELADVYPATA